SRRRHTRSKRDWSSDVCSSDLENRRNSFSREDETILRRIQQPLTITVVLSPEDPRLADFDQNVLRKLQRVMPRLRVNYAASTVRSEERRVGKGGKTRWST